AMLDGAVRSRHDERRDRADRPAAGSPTGVPPGALTEEERMRSPLSSAGVSVIEQLAAYAATESFDKRPEAPGRAARRAILDTLGVMIAGSAEATAARARALIARRRGSEEATVVGTPLRAPIEDAALANGTAAHALDYDDVQASLSG